MTYLNFAELRAKLGNRGRTTVYRDIEAGRLPKPIKLGGRLYWVESEIDDTLAGLVRGMDRHSETAGSEKMVTEK